MICEWIKKGIVEDAPVMEANSPCLHYLPHYAIIRSDKNTTKIRVVYDASAKIDGKPSLNDCLLIGPIFNQKILDILMMFVPDCTNSRYREGLPHDLSGGQRSRCSLLLMSE